MCGVGRGGGERGLWADWPSPRFFFFPFSLSAAAGMVNIVRGKGGRDPFSGPPPLPIPGGNPSPTFRHPLVSVRSCVLAARVRSGWNTSSYIKILRKNWDH